MRLLLLMVLLCGSARAETLTIFAASSLTEVFTEIASAFEAEHPGAEIRLNFAGSSVLATQLEQGAPADLFASADLANLLRVVSEDDAVTFASNRIVVITAGESRLTDLTDLAEQDYLLVLAGETVPAGQYARTVLSNLNKLYGETYAAQVLSHLVSSETNVRQVMAKVVLGEADAALVYTTDAAAYPKLATLAIPDAYNVSALYSIAVVPESRNARLAHSFVSYLLSDAGQRQLKAQGFLSPP